MAIEKLGHTTNEIITVFNNLKWISPVSCNCLISMARTDSAAISLSDALFSKITERSACKMNKKK